MSVTLYWLQVTHICVGVLVLVGLAAFWVRRGCHDPLRRCPPRGNRLTPVAIVICIAVYFAAAKIASDLLPMLAPALSKEVQHSVVNLCAQVAGIASVLVVGALRFRRGLVGLGFTTRRLGVSILAGVLLFLAFEPVGTGLLSAMIELFKALGIPVEAHPTLNLIHDPTTPRWYVPIAWISAAAFAPLAEEGFFRGLLQTLFRRLARSRWVGLIAAASLFGGVHYVQPTAVLPLAAFGLFAGFAYERTGSLVGPLLFHACFNLKTLILQTLSGPNAPL